MLGLDSITLVVLTGLAHIVLAALLFCVKKPPGDTAFLRLFAASQLCLAVSLLSIVFRTTHSHGLFVSLINVVFTVGGTLMLLAVAHVFRWPYRDRIVWVYLPIIALQFVMHHLGFSEQQRLTGVILLASTPQCLLIWIYTRQWSQGTRLLRLVVVGNGFILVMYLSRLAEALSASQGYDFFHAGLGQALGLLGAYCFALFNGFGLLLVLNERAQRELRELSSLDAMTGALNRQGFVANAQHFLTLADQQSLSLVIAFCSLRQLKQMNQQSGNYYGDQTILRAVSALRQQLTEQDLLGRWQGHQFVVLLHHKTVSEGVEWAQAVQANYLNASNVTTSQPHDALHIALTLYRNHEDFWFALQRAEEGLRAIDVNEACTVQTIMP